MKKYALFLTVLVSSAATAEQLDLALGSWSCNVESPYQLDDAKVSFQINKDLTYEKTTIIHGSKMTDLGSYTIDSDVLELDRRFHIVRGNKKPSKSQFSRKIQTLDTNNLILTWADSKLICTK